MRDIHQFREMLLEHGFEEASQRSFYFWKILTDKTAFIINLKALSAGVGVVYGVISTAIFWTEADWDFFKTRGRDDGDCNLRYYLEIHSANDEAAARDVIGRLYTEYLHMDKDMLLAVVKERRKQFIQQITNVLKPLGFRKKGNQWRKPLSENILLQFWADKSSYSDLYYFEVSIYSLVASPVGFGCYFERIDTRGTEIFDWKNYAQPQHQFDWQLQSTDDLLEIVHRTYEEKLRPFIENDLLEMGKQRFVWKGCMCDRKRCAECWVEKNYRESRD